MGGRLLITRWAAGVSVVMGRQLVHALTAMPATLSAGDVDAVFEVARRSTTWTTPRAFPGRPPAASSAE